MEGSKQDVKTMGIMVDGRGGKDGIIKIIIAHDPTSHCVMIFSL